MFCKKCGAQLKDGTVFCGKCGAKVEDAQAQQDAPAAEQKQADPAMPQGTPGKGKGAIIVIAAVLLVLVGAGIGGALVMLHSSSDKVGSANVEEHSEAQRTKEATDDESEGSKETGSEAKEQSEQADSQAKENTEQNTDKEDRASDETQKAAEDGGEKSDADLAGKWTTGGKDTIWCLYEQMEVPISYTLEFDGKGQFVLEIAPQEEECRAIVREYMEEKVKTMTEAQLKTEMKGTKATTVEEWMDLEEEYLLKVKIVHGKAWFKYTFDGSKIESTLINGSDPETMEVSIEGDKLIMLSSTRPDDYTQYGMEFPITFTRVE